ncbi:MAG: DUF4253 domain-containing protein [Oscillospiraceae bacterium]|nr:DUF4253 domain-containing protein [Oscillospiraceae bacterium]
MSFLDFLFSPKKNKAITESCADNTNFPSQTALKIAELLGCKCSHIAPCKNPKSVWNKYLAACDGDCDCTPLLIKVSDTLLEMLEINYSECGGAAAYRQQILSADTSGGEEFLISRYNEMCSETLLKSKADELSDTDDEYVSEGYDMSISINDDGICHEFILAYIPVKPWEIFAYVPFGGWNDCPDSEDIVKACRFFYEKYQAVPCLISSDVLEMYLPEPVSEGEAFHLAELMYGFDYDIVDQGCGSIKALAELISRSRLWYFWWD